MRIIIFYSHIPTSWYSKYLPKYENSGNNLIKIHATPRIPTVASVGAPNSVDHKLDHAIACTTKIKPLDNYILTCRKLQRIFHCSRRSQ